MTSSVTATGSFEIELSPATGVLPGTGRFDFSKTWTGEIDGTSQGVMLSAGDPQQGNAGYVCLEVFTGVIAGRSGTVTFQQEGRMSGGDPELAYVITPGSGTDELAGVIGTVDLQVDKDGTHNVTITLLDR